MAKSERLLTIKEFAARKRYSERTIRQMCKDGKIKAHKLTKKSRKWLIQESEIDKVVSAKVVPQKVTQVEIAPVISKRIEEHFDRMTAIADALLANGLDVVRRHPISGRTEGFEYSIVSGNSVEFLSHEQLGDRLRLNLGFTWVHGNDLDRDCFLSHLRAEYPELESKDILTIVTENPYKLIVALRVLARRKIFKGTCTVCEHW